MGFRLETRSISLVESTRKETWKSVWSLFCVVEESEHFLFFSIYVIRVGERCRFCQVEEVCVCLEFNEGVGAGHPFIV